MNNMYIFAPTNQIPYFSMNLNQDYGKKLLLLRTEARKTQDGVADALGISQKTYSDLEKGEAAFKLEYVDKLAKLYKVEPMDIVRNLLTDEKIIIHKIADSNGAFTAQGSVVQAQSIDAETFKVLVNQMAQVTEINKFLLQEIKIMKGERNQE
jgi:transcriptional regulator with XRE-family HTH domain